MAELSDLDARILAFEDAAPAAPAALGRKEEAIRTELGLSPTRYYQRLNALIDVPAAIAAYPLLLSRLRRRRDMRAQERRAAKIYNRAEQ